MRFPFFTASIITLLFSSSLMAMPDGDATKGEIKTPSCRFCHGSNGIAPRPDYPNLKGQNAEYLYNSMQAYLDGSRTGGMSSMMKAQLKNLSDQDIADISEYYSQMK
ncbi:cytochrome c554 [Photobacterium sp. SKA34]|uniref:c-type cytochrome n=1 Tax=Photobacterium sp. SKA34 TaxID=121723 RepID=UPI00006B34B6|nr:cytochrome c [Photobacterium sp. SKA34]EAR53837.1 cytochrome c554 [Photobacterium sp. SKA34]